MFTINIIISVLIFLFIITLINCRLFSRLTSRYNTDNLVIANSTELSIIKFIVNIFNPLLCGILVLLIISEIFILLKLVFIVCTFALALFGILSYIKDSVDNEYYKNYKFVISETKTMHGWVYFKSINGELILKYVKRIKMSIFIYTLSMTFILLVLLFMSLNIL